MPHEYLSHQVDHRVSTLALNATFPFAKAPKVQILANSREQVDSLYALTTSQYFSTLSDCEGS